MKQSQKQGLNKSMLVQTREMQLTQAGTFQSKPSIIETQKGSFKQRKQYKLN